MKTVEILGENHFEVQTKTRVACRGVVILEGNILLTYEKNTDQYFIPGGGLEGEESLEECCVRELAEETGYVVMPCTQFLTIHEYYEEWFFVSHYFVCEVQGETVRKLTEREREVGLEPKWIPLEDAIEIFSRHQEYAATDEMKRGAYLREFEALSCLKEGY
ncbi:MAG: NUDIX domain-containing protein [Lachnospiraceae bacterium]|nr:NUDIX domain-containing protein [Lachnospiraceae bacterium]